MHTRSNLGRHGFALVALGLLVATLAGCDSRTPTANAADSVRAASQNSSEADSFSFEMTIAMEGVSGFDLDITAEGAYDILNRRMRMTMDLLGQEAEAVSDGDNLFLRMPMLGDSWLRQDLDAPGGSAVSGATEDPTKVLEWLSATGDDVQDLGEDTVRGERARHYRALLNLRDTASKLDDEHRERVEQVIELLGTDAMEVDVWVNDADLPVKLEYEMSFEKSEIDELRDAVMEFSLEYFDWGEPVSVTLPDPADVRDLEDALGSLLDD